MPTKCRVVFAKNIFRYDVMNGCWVRAPDSRPTFQELLVKFTLLLERTQEGYGYLAILKDCNSENETPTVTASTQASKIGRIAQSFCLSMRTVYEIFFVAS